MPIIVKYGPLKHGTLVTLDPPPERDDVIMGSRLFAKYLAVLQGEDVIQGRVVLWPMLLGHRVIENPYLDPDIALVPVGHKSPERWHAAIARIRESPVDPRPAYFFEMLMAGPTAIRYTLKEPIRWRRCILLGAAIGGWIVYAIAIWKF